MTDAPDLSEPKPKREADDACTKREATLYKDGRCVLWTWGPQVGGYTWNARVRFYAGDHCFDVDVYHDGDFPRDVPTIELHGCDPLQLVRFGLDIAEAQAKAAKEMGRDEPETLESAKLVERLRAVLTEADD